VAQFLFDFLLWRGLPGIRFGRGGFGLKNAEAPSDAEEDSHGRDED
jgi:hypothetical protein